VAAIALAHVSKTYPNGYAAARDLTLDIHDGELLVLVGPSGSGKSTILRLIAGLETPSSGRISIGGRDVTGEPPQQRDLAMVFQSYALYPHKTVRENLAFALRLRRLAAHTIEDRVRATAALLGIEALLDRKPAQLSGGQRQRVALGRAMVREPKAFLLDEPLSNLDPVLRAATRAELALLHRRLAATMVYVTHDQEEAMTLGTRIAVLRDGVLEQVAPALELFHRPANAFVGGFVGAPAMNFWPCTYRAEASRTVLVSPVGCLELAAGRVDERNGADLLLGVRPHDIELVADGSRDETGRVALIEPLGASAVIHLDVDRTPRHLVRVVVPDAPALTFGDVVGFRLRRDRLHIFDARTGRRVGGQA
jgi:ABC-type sugar transport system ATPase subunit